MKKTILTAVLFISSIFYVFAQDSTNVKPKTYEFGIRLGTSIYNIESEFENPSFTGLYGGLFVQKHFSEKFSIQLEANYTGQDLLSFPVLLNYKITDKFEVYGGAELNFSLGQPNVAEEFRNKRFGASLVIGAKYNIDSKWFIEGRYSHGVSDQFPIFQGFGTESVYGKRRIFNIGIGYKF